MQATRRWAWGKGSRGSGYGHLRNTGFFWKVHCRVEAGRCRDLAYIVSVFFFSYQACFSSIVGFWNMGCCFPPNRGSARVDVGLGLIKLDVLQQLDCVIVIVIVILIVARCDQYQYGVVGDNECQMLRLRLSWRPVENWPDFRRLRKA